MLAGEERSCGSYRRDVKMEKSSASEEVGAVV